MRVRFLCFQLDSQLRDEQLVIRSAVGTWKSFSIFACASPSVSYAYVVDLVLGDAVWEMSKYIVCGGDVERVC